MFKFEIIACNKVIQPKLLNCNLTLIDSDLPKIIIFIMNRGFIKISLFDLIKLLEKENPIKYDDSQGHRFYYLKLIKFVDDVLSGLNGDEVWTGVQSKRFDLVVLNRVYFEREFCDVEGCKLVLCLKLTGLK